MWCLLVLFFLSPSYGLELPKNLNHNERLYVVENLGVPSSTKLLTNPYPLGGYSGFEMGVSYQFLDTEEFSNLGDKLDDASNLHLMEISIGKGLYNNFDLFFHFSPYNQSQNSSGYGGTVRWSFYQAKFLPVNFSISAHSGTLHLGGQYIGETLGADFTAGIIVEDLSLYLGAGTVEAEGIFMAGSGVDSVIDSDDGSIDASTQKLREKISSEHLFVGLNVQMGDLFFVVQMDRYQQTLFSGKIGLRL